MTGSQSQALGTPMDSHLLSQNQTDDEILCVSFCWGCSDFKPPFSPKERTECHTVFLRMNANLMRIILSWPQWSKSSCLCVHRELKRTGAPLYRLWYLTGAMDISFTSQSTKRREKRTPEVWEPHCERFQHHSSNPNSVSSVLRTLRERAERAQSERVNSSSALSCRSQDTHNQYSRTGEWNQISNERTRHSAVISNWLIFLLRKALL